MNLDIKILAYHEAVPDDVDLIIEAWQRERPDLDVTPLHALSRLTRFAQRLDRERRRSFALHGLATWEFDVLAALRRAGDPYALSPGSLGALTHVTSGTMTNRIDRLQERGLVDRQPDPSDRRGVRVVLTASGLAAVDSALQDLVGKEREILAPLTARERDELADLLRRLMDNAGQDLEK